MFLHLVLVDFIPVGAHDLSFKGVDFLCDGWRCGPSAGFVRGALVNDSWGVIFFLDMSSKRSDMSFLMIS